MFSALMGVGFILIAVLLYVAPLRWSLLLMLAVALLVPSGVVVPHAPSSQLTFPRLAVAAFGVGVAVKHRRGVAPGAFKPTRMHVALGIYLAVSFVLGVVLAGPQVTTRASMRDWWTVLEIAVFFTAVLGALRQIDLRWAARMTAALVLVTAVIATAEHLTRHGYAAAWFRHLHQLPGGDRSVLALQTRGGQVRVQAASLFALEYGWVTAMWLPLVAVVALWSRRRWALIAPVLVVAVIAWTYSRSVWAGLVVGGLLLVAGSRADRRLLRAVVVAGVLGIAAVVASPSLRAPFHASDTAGSSASRVTRAELIAQSLSRHPYRGLGFGGLTPLGLPGADDSYVLAYAELGTLGVVAVAVVFLTAVGEGLAGLRIPKGRERSLATAALCGIVVAVIAAAAYDLIGIEQSLLTVMFLTAFAIALRERCLGSGDGAAFRSLSLRAGAVVVGSGLLVGMAAWGLTPRHWAGTWRIQTVQARRLDEENSSGHEAFPGSILRNSVCDLLHQAALARGDVRLDCPHSFSNPLGAGIGDVRIQAPSRRAVEAVASAVFPVAPAYFPGFDAQVVEPVSRGTPTMARVAPVSGGLLGLAIALLLPVPFRRRRVSGAVMELRRPGSRLDERGGSGLPARRHGGVLEPLVPGGDQHPVGE